MPHNTVSKHVTIAGGALHVHSQALDYPVQSVIDISGATRILRTINRVSRIRNLFASAKRFCKTCGALLSGMTRDCRKKYCLTCKQFRATGHLCYIRPLKDVVQANGDNLLYMFYDFETTQNKTYSDTSKEYVPNIVCVKQFCVRCEEIDERGINCDRCGRRRHSFWNDSVGDLFTYLCEPRPWASKIVAIAHNAKAFDLHFILNRAIMLKCKFELITNGLKIISMKMEHLVFLDSVSFLPCALRNLAEAFGLQAAKSWYLHYLNTEENLNYVGPMHDI